MKKLATIAMAGAMLLGLSACGPEEHSEGWHQVYQWCIDDNIDAIGEVEGLNHTTLHEDCAPHADTFQGMTRDEIFNSLTEGK